MSITFTRRARRGLRLALAAAGLMALQAQAQVLFLSTAESRGDAIQLTSTARDAFRNASSGGFTDRTGALGEAAALDPALFDGQKIVVLATTYGAMAPAQVPVLRQVMLNRPDLTFIMFPDGCCETPANLAPLVGIINEGTGWNVSLREGGGGPISAPLNQNSLYRGSFAALDPFVGGWYSGLQNVPADNAVYLDPERVAAPPFPAAGSLTSAYGLLVPQQRFNGGKGACIFLTADISPFGVSGQPEKIAAAFMHAANDPAGACKQPTREPDLGVTLTPPGAVAVGAAATFDVTVANVGVVDAAASTLTVAIPAGFTIEAGSLPAGCTTSGQSVSCPAPALGAGASQNFSIRTTPTQVATDAPVSATVAPINGETHTANNTANATVTVRAAPVGAAATPVPTLGEWASFALTALLGLLAARRLPGRRGAGHAGAA